jgi:hypothetical protein
VPTSATQRSDDRGHGACSSATSPRCVRSHRCGRSPSSSTRQAPRSRRSADSAMSAAQPANSPTVSGERSYRASLARNTRASSPLNTGPPLMTAPRRAGSPGARRAPTTTASPLASRHHQPAAAARPAPADPSTEPGSRQHCRPPAGTTARSRPTHHQMSSPAPQARGRADRPARPPAAPAPAMNQHNE